jgi:hypothetical protein
MDALEFFLIRYESLHGDDDNRLLHGLTDAQVRCTPYPGVNSLAWYLWHTTRCEDIGVNRLVVDRSQVLFGEGWPIRLNVSLKDIGTGMADDEVTNFSARVDLEALRAYRAAVGRRTLDVVGTLHPSDLEQVLDPAQIRRVIAEGALVENADWVREYWQGKTRGWCLAQLGLTHNFSHFGQANLVRGMLGLRGR